jgi:ribosome maturation factor RimP
MTNAELGSKIFELAHPLVKATDGFLVDVVVKQEGGTSILQVFFDTEPGVTIEQCAQVSRELNRAIEMQRLIERSYQLEVSSPGIDRPLKLLQQYKKNIGREYRVRYRAEGITQELVGNLEAVAEERISFRSKQGDTTTLEFESILESLEVLPW